MVWNFFRAVPKTCLGIDIGTSSVRIVELSSWRGRRKLENYSELSSESFSSRQLKTVKRDSCILSNEEIAEVIKAILAEAKIKTKKVVLSVPDFSSFFTWFELPSMTREEISEAIQYEARRHIPFSLSEVAIDWQIIKGFPDKKEKENLKILLVAVPNNVVEQYREIASRSQLELLAMEAEVFGLSRALIKNNAVERVMAIIDIGAQSTTVSIVEAGVLKRSHSFDIAGNQLTDILARGLSTDYKKTEELKKKYGLQEEQNIRKILVPLIDLIINEIKKVCQSFSQAEEKEVQKIIIAGGSSLIPGLRDYFAEQLQKEIEIGNPFSNLFYPPILENTLKKMGPLYAIAVGAALRGIE